MEITFFANFPISIIGMIAMKNMFDIDRIGLKINRSACNKMFGFIFGSLLTLGHYRTEPPSTYRWEVNLTIAGEGFITILLAIANYYCRKQTNDQKYEPVAQDDADNVKIHENQFSKDATRHRSPHRKN
uniref:Uncharacterized protein n=1 Tax=Acrobeloides nanus TaxID=290746 RepID=A0A914CSG7_9BILA